VDPGTILDYRNALCTVIGEFKGIWKLRNIDDASAVVAFACSGAEINLDSSIDGGYFVLLGDGEVTGTPTSTGTWSDNLIRGTRLNKAWDGTVGTRVVDQTTDPAQWKLRVKKGDDDSTNSHSFDLVDGDGTPISDTNPLLDFIAERNRI
jgi:hypothetical protein